MKKPIFFALILFFSVVFIKSCKKDKNDISPPIFEDYSFKVGEYSQKGKVIGTLRAIVYDQRDLSYSILEGNTNNAFYLDSATGEIKVSNPEDFENEGINEYHLIVLVQDEYGEEVTATLTIEIVDIASIENFIAYYSFNGNADDLSNNNNHGEVHGVVLTSDQYGNENSAYYFDGINSYIKIDPMNVSQINDFTFSVRANCESWNEQPEYYGGGTLNEQFVFDGLSGSELPPDLRDGFNLKYELTDYDTENIYYTVLKQGQGIGSIYTADSLINNWIHSVFSRKGDSLFWYVNGSLVKSTQFNSTTFDMQDHWYIGTYAGNSYITSVNNNFHGKIDEMMFFNIALDSDKIKEL